MAGRFSRLASGITGTFRSGGWNSSQVYAALVLPFFIVFSIVLAKVTHEILLDFMPDSIAAVAALRVMLGTLLVIATGVAWLMWVRSGGFGLFE